MLHENFSSKINQPKPPWQKGGWHCFNRILHFGQGLVAGPLFRFHLRMFQ
jgi:hypothetical protein